MKLEMRKSVAESEGDAVRLALEHPKVKFSIYSVSNGTSVQFVSSPNSSYALATHAKANGVSCKLANGRTKGRDLDGGNRLVESLVCSIMDGDKELVAITLRRVIASVGSEQAIGRLSKLNDAVKNVGRICFYRNKAMDMLRVARKASIAQATVTSSVGKV